MIKTIKNWLNKEKNQKDDAWIFGSMLVGGIAGLLASFELSIQSLILAANPEASLSCSINAVINCASVALHPSAELLGFPNSFIGLITMPVVITIAVAVLMGTKFPKLFMFLAQIGYTLGLIFAYALLYVSIFIIQVICPWCFLLYIAMTVIFFALLRYNIREDNLYLPQKWQKEAEKFIQNNYDRLTMAIIIVAILALIIFKYGADLFA